MMDSQREKERDKSSRQKVFSHLLLYFIAKIQLGYDSSDIVWGIDKEVHIIINTVLRLGTW